MAGSDRVRTANLEVKKYESLSFGLAQNLSKRTDAMCSLQLSNNSRERANLHKAFIKLVNTQAPLTGFASTSIYVTKDL